MSVASGVASSRSRRSSAASGLKPEGISSRRKKANRRSAILETAAVAEAGLFDVGVANGTSSPIMRSRSSSEDEVQISLGIQEGIERAWQAALTKIGSISLAWQNEAAMAHNMDAPTKIDPASIFGNVQPLATAQQSGSTLASSTQTPTADAQVQIGSSKAPELAQHTRHRHHHHHRIKAAGRSRSASTSSALTGTRSIRSDSHAIANANQPASHTGDILGRGANDGGFSDHAAETRHRSKTKAKTKRRKAHSKPQTPLIVSGAKSPQHIAATASAVAVPESPLSADQQKRKQLHRRSIRLHRLLPLQTPDSSRARHSRSLSRDFPSQLPVDSQPVKEAATSSEQNTPYIDAKTPRSSIVVLHKRTNSLPHIGIADAQAETQGSEPGSAQSSLLFSGISENRPLPLSEEGLAGDRDSQQHGTGAWTTPLAPIAEATSSRDRGSQAPDENRLASLEEQVSVLLNEIGMHSPCKNATSNSERKSREQSSNRILLRQEPGAVPWFHQPQYTPKMEESASGKEVLLVDDDSSCAEYILESDHNHGRLPISGASVSSRIRRHTGASAVSTAEGSVGSTAIDPSYQRPNPWQQRIDRQRRLSGVNTQAGRSPSGLQPRLGTAVCSNCRDLRLPCSQMHTILERLEQTDMYVKNVARHASAIDSLLADLRAQSRVLAETLSVSQARASSLSQTVTDAIDNAITSIHGNEPDKDAWHGTAAAAEKATSSVGVRSRLSSYSKLSKKARDLEMRAQTMLVPGPSAFALPGSGQGLDADQENKSSLYSWIKDAVAISAQATSASDSEAAAKPSSASHAANTKSHLVDHLSKADDALSSRASSNTRPSRRHKKGRHSSKQHRRPVQPISVRVQRINSQWSELCTTIDTLNISGPADAETTANADKAAASSGNEHAADIAADGLKLLQRVLKTTLESLKMAKTQADPGADLSNSLSNTADLAAPS